MKTHKTRIILHHLVFKLPCQQDVSKIFQNCVSVSGIRYARYEVFHKLLFSMPNSCFFFTQGGHPIKTMQSLLLKNGSFPSFGDFRIACYNML